MGLWKELLNSGRMFYGDVRDQLAWKPHYHCIVATDWFKTADFTKWIEAATGWVVHCIKDADGNSLYSDGDMARALTYSLSHGDIDVHVDSNNSSAANYVGAALGSIFKSSPRFVATDSDLNWADGKVREHCWRLLGLNSASTECGASIPPVDDPNELARKVMLELYPDDDPPAHVNTEGVLYHVAKGNIRVDVSTTSGGGGNVTVCDAFGQKLGGSSGLDGGFPVATGDGTRVIYSGEDSPIRVVDEDGADQGNSCGDGCGHDHGDDDQDHVCDGTMIPLTEARKLGLLEDEEWCADAPFIEQARKADREWPDDLDRWKSKPIVNAVGVS
jgi:hypothetical protein